MTHHYHQSWFTLGFTHGVMLSWLWTTVGVACIHQHSTIYITSTALKIFYSSATHPSLPLIPGNRWSFYHLHSFAFYRMPYSKKHIRDFLKIGIELIYNVFLVTGAQQNQCYTYIYTHTHTHTHSFQDSFPVQAITENTDYFNGKNIFLHFSFLILFLSHS